MAPIAGILRVEKRNDPRFPVHMRVAFVWRGQTIEAVVLDVSASGLRVRSEVDLPVAAHFELRFAPRSRLSTHSVPGTVKWSDASPEIVGMYECGIRFAQLPPATLHAFGQLLAELSADSEVPLVDDEDVELVEEPAMTPAQLRAQLEEALDADRSQRQRDSDLSHTLSQQARRLRQSGDAAGAITSLRRAIELTPGSVELIEELADALYSVNEVLEAAALFDRALRLRQETGGKQ